MKIELTHNEFGGWIMECESANGISVQYPKSKEDLLKRLRVKIMNEL